jgi:hypothetical protein
MTQEFALSEDAEPIGHFISDCILDTSAENLKAFLPLSSRFANVNLLL